MLAELVILLLSVLALYLMSRKDPDRLLNIYSQPGKWFRLKKILFVILLTVRKYRLDRAKRKEEHLRSELTETNGRGEESNKAPGPGYGVRSHNSVEDMERPQKLANHEDAIDCMYFNGLNAEGVYFVMRIARRNNRRAELWLSVNVPGVGFFQAPVHPSTVIYNTDEGSFSAAGLKFECVLPMKRWRITFNGLLRKGAHNSSTEIGQGEMCHVRFSFLWSAFSDLFDFDTDIHPNCLAESVARELWSRSFFDRLRKSHQTHYEQWGEMFGVFQAEGHEERRLSLRGYRDHSYGIRDWYSFHRYAINFAYLEDGTAFHVDSISMPDTLSLLQCGYLSRPNAIMHPVSWTDMDMLALGENQNPPKNYEFNFIANSTNYNVQVTRNETMIYYLHEDHRSMIVEQICSYVVNGVKGYGVFEFVYRNPRITPMNIQKSLPLLTTEVSPNSTNCKLILTFSEPACTSSSLVGGKGCQLASLTQLNSKKFKVPEGFCLTIQAFEQHLINNPSLRLLLSHLHDISCTEFNDLKRTCDETVEAFKKVPICTEVSDKIMSGLLAVFGSEHLNTTVAVRSSAAGEDGSELSAAGQMQTFLGIKGLHQICDAVVSCWASHFDFPAVAYRRQNGQPIVSAAGVVIQKMAPSKAAGVLFTRDPVSGNPGMMIINANFGLGESVVSGEAEPDQVSISRSWDDKVSIVKKEIGSKKLRVILSDDGGTKNDSNENSAECCLDDDNIRELVLIGIELEYRFGDPRDMEFAVGADNVIYVLQARPITTLDQDNEWMLMHEFDTALATDRELCTTANVQEMMPGAMTPLTISFFMQSMEHAGQESMVDVGVHPRQHMAAKFCSLRCNKAFINLTYVMGLYEGTSSIADKRMSELSLLGETLSDYSVDEVRAYNGVLPLWKRIRSAFLMMKRFYSADAYFKLWVDRAKLFTIADRQYNSALELYVEISRNLPIMDSAWDFHMRMSMGSAVWSSVIMSILTKGGHVWTSQHFSDVALLLSKCEDVYSADVPAALKKLADRISSSDFKDRFSKASPEEAVAFLRSPASGSAGEEFKEFLNRHGHRCVREAELREKSWRSEPIKVVRVVQAMMQTPHTTREAPSGRKINASSLIDKLQSPITSVGRLVLKWILPKAQKSVGARETSKSVAVNISDVFKEAYRKLGAMMVQESRLPDEDLLFFLTHAEIGHVLHTRSAKLLNRAQKRRQLLAKQNAINYQRVSRGHARKIELNTTEKQAVILSKLKGMPVSQGVVTGTARVVTCLDDASLILSGEILIVPYTDVGWSPYFPIISGLATEIGGLLSHGAVVAREYGLPCVVNLANATQHFKSGDTVTLNGTRGTLEKLEN